MEEQGLSRSEAARKLVHIGFGLVALALRWLSTWQAAGLAVAALAFNFFLLPHLGGRKIARSARGFDRGILLYPLSVLIVILAFAGRPALAAATWILLAFGDGLATLGGKIVGGPSLPWNHDKSWGGFLSFFLAAVPAWLVGRFVAGDQELLAPSAGAVLLATLAAAIVESLPTTIDDNLTVPLAGGLILAGAGGMLQWSLPSLGRAEWLWLGANLLFAGVGYVLRSVDVSGAVAGAILGGILIVFGGWPLYVTLLAFFAVGSAVTRAGYATKRDRGLAQEGGGRRRFTHAVANVGVAAILALLVSGGGDRAYLFYLAAVGALATAAADTTGSEIGQLLGRRAFLPLSLRRVDPGTEGAISVEGTVAGALAGMLVAVTGLAAASWSANRSVPWRLLMPLALAAALGSLTESIVGSWNRKRSRSIPNGLLNFFNTMVGAALTVLPLRLM